MLLYMNWQEIWELDTLTKIVWLKIKSDIDTEENRKKEIQEKRKNAWKKWWDEKAKGSKKKQDVAKGSKGVAKGSKKDFATKEEKNTKNDDEIMATESGEVELVAKGSKKNDDLYIYNYIYFNNININNIFIEYLKIRENKKIKNTKKAIELLIKKIKSFPEEDREEMIENAIINGRQSIYPLKTQNANYTRQTPRPSNSLQDSHSRDYASENRRAYEEYGLGRGLRQWEQGASG